MNTNEREQLDRLIRRRDRLEGRITERGYLTKLRRRKLVRAIYEGGALALIMAAIIVLFAILGR